MVHWIFPCSPDRTAWRRSPIPPLLTSNSCEIPLRWCGKQKLFQIATISLSYTASGNSFQVVASLSWFLWGTLMVGFSFVMVSNWGQSYNNRWSSIFVNDMATKDANTECSPKQNQNYLSQQWIEKESRRGMWLSSSGTDLRNLCSLRKIFIWTKIINPENPLSLSRKEGMIMKIPKKGTCLWCDNRSGICWCRENISWNHAGTYLRSVR